MAAPRKILRPEIDWQTAEYGVFDPKQSRPDDLPAANRFGMPVSPFEIRPGGEDPEPPPPPQDGQVGLPFLYENGLTADTDTSATLEAWTDLPGLSRTIGVDRPSVAFVTATVVILCEDESDVAGAECRLRIVVNGDEASGHSRVSFTGAYGKLPGKNVKSIRTVDIKCTFKLEPDTDYTYKVQIANYGDATTYTALKGSATKPDSNMHMILFKGKITNIPDDAGPGNGSGAEDSNWIKILDIGYARSTDRLYALRIRGEYDTDTPAQATVPDRAYIEVVYYDYTEIPITATLGGTRIWKRAVTASLWQDCWSLSFSVDRTSGDFAACYTEDVEPTATSRTYYFVMVTAGGNEIVYETWDGPNWHNDVDGYSTQYASGIYSSIYFYCVVPTTDTAAKSSSAPFKSGWRLVKRNCLRIGGGITTLNQGAVVSQKDLLPEAGQRFKIPICLVYDGGDARLILLERIGVGNTRLYYPTADTVIAGGALGSEIIMGGFVPDAGQTVWLWNQAIPNIYMFVRQGFSDLYEWSSGGSTADLWDDTQYQGDYEFTKIDLLSRPTNEILMFDRGVQGNALTAPWVIKVPGNQGGTAGNQ